MLIDDLETWNRLIATGEGFIYNDFGTQFPGDSPTWNTTNFNKLHTCSCTYVKRMKYETEGKLTKHYFDTKKQALQWLNNNRKDDGYTFCKCIEEK